MNAAEGILNVDKPTGLTSHDVVAQVRRLAGMRRVGHAGTLDPLATGVLLVCLGRTTRLVEYLVGRLKTYETAIRLGQATDTYDAEGVVVEERPVAVALGDLETALAQFRGPIRQRPPLYSAVKQGGRPLYKLARHDAAQAAQLERPLREVIIHELTLLEFARPLLRLRVLCSSGTYIRSLAHDLGQALGCGGHVVALRRLAVGEFGLDMAVPLDQLTAENWQEYLLPGDAAVAHLPRLGLDGEESLQLQQGKRLLRRSDQPSADLVRAYDTAGRFIGVVAAEGKYWRPHKILV
jgi:tRNA pseudouridine55 synthase